jgi:hypothetical protein
MMNARQFGNLINSTTQLIRQFGESVVKTVCKSIEAVCAMQVAAAHTGG